VPGQQWTLAHHFDVKELARRGWSFLSDDKKPNTKLLYELHKEFLASKGYEISQRLFSFDRSNRIFVANCDDLHSVIDKHLSANLWIASKDEKQQQIVDDELFQISRHLHNTVAAAVSLVDHTRVFYQKHYQNSELIPDYDLQIETRFKKDGLSNFIKCLRQFCQHYRTPVISSVLYIDNNHGQHVRRIILVKNDLLEFSNWNPPAKNFLASLPDDIPMNALVEQYRKHVVDFYEWFMMKLENIHSADLEHARSLVKAMQDIRSKERPPIFTRITKSELEERR
jgi:hypothetical protein